MTPTLDPITTRHRRLQMVNQQLRPRGIADQRVLHAMAMLPREDFLPPELEEDAYVDGPLPIGQGQTISQPYMVAVMAELLALTGDETVLEIGAGSGYAAAVLALLARRVITIERHAGLLALARQRWHGLGLANITGITGDGTLGWAEAAPYDAISVTAAAPSVPPTLLAQLRRDTGRMVIPVGNRMMQTLLVVRPDPEQQPRIQECFHCMFVPLLGQEGWQP